MKTGLRLAISCTVFQIASLAAAEPPIEARAILEKAQAAVKAVQVVSYTGEYTITGYYARELPTVRGKVLLGKQSVLKLDRFVCDVELKMPGSDEWSAYPIGSNGDRFYLFDHKVKLLREDIDTMVMGPLARHAQRILLREFAAVEPFKDDLLAKSISLRDAQSIGGEDCYVVHASQRPSLPFDMVWHISKKDFLPRRVERIFRRETEEATTAITLTDLKVDPKFDRDPFEAVLPAGYTKTEAFPE